MIKLPKHILFGITIFIVLSVVNMFRIYYEFNTYTLLELNTNKKELITIQTDMRKISDSIFYNIIDTSSVINIFKNAYVSDKIKKDGTREELYNLLKDRYVKFKKHGVKQLHFHLPDNESFLRFHKPEKYGDNLTKIRESVRLVNYTKKPIFGYEEGKVLGGYRVVYPLFDENSKHIGSVEVSVSLSLFKDIFQKEHHTKHIDFIVAKDIIKEKIFKSQLDRYMEYHDVEDFLIELPLHNKNKEECEHNNKIASFFNDSSIKRKMIDINEYSFLKIIDYELYTMDLIPLKNDFLNKKIGYKVIFAKSDYLEYFSLSLISSFIGVLLLSIFIGYLRYIYQKSLEYQKEKEEIKLSNEKLLSTNLLIRSVIDNTEDLIFYKDKDFNYVGCNEAFSQFAGKPKKEIIGSNDFELFDEKFAIVFRNMDNLLLHNNEVSSNYEWAKHLDGNEVYFYTQRIPFKYDSKNPDRIGILGISRDLTELYNTQNELRKQTYTDELTQVRNRKSYNKRISEFFNEYERYKTPFSLIILDIDFFKMVNDTYGHKTGDEVLICLAKTIVKTIRKNDYFFRVGGEEFVVLTKQDTAEGTLMLAEHIRKNVEQNVNVIKEQIITVSIGATTVKEDDTEDSIFRRADENLYISKNNGRNRVTIK